MPGLHHRPLKDDADEFRLLWVRPRCHDDEPLFCELQTHKLSERPNYVALSYAWGPREYCEIILGGLPYRVTNNLRAALRSLQVSGEQVVWADAICMDQDNKDEKSRQIRLMHRIYSQAKFVLISLGDAGLNQHAVASVISGLGHCKFDKDEYGSTEPPEDWISKPDLTAWRVILDLALTPWPTRTWIVQEAVSCANIRIMYGKIGFCWRCFPRLLDSLNEATLHNMFEWNRYFPEKARKAFLRTYESVSNINDMRITPREKMSLLWILRGLRTQLSYKAVDKIYGVLALAVDVGEYEAPDYNKTVEQVYTAFAVTTLSKWPKKLNELLAEAGIQNQGLALQSRIPSWAPDWTCPPRIFSLNHFMLPLEDGLPLPETEREKMRSCFQADVQLQDDIPLLLVKGEFLDIITRLGPIRDSTKWNGLLEWIEASEQVLPTDSESEKQRLLAVASFGFLEPSALIKGLHPLLRQRFIDLLKWYLKIDIEPLFTPEGEMLPSHKDRALRAGTMERCLCVTADAKLGMVSPCAAEGDFVALLDGFPCPVVLRGCGDNFILVGDMYFEGDDSGWSLDQRDETQLSDILLQ